MVLFTESKLARLILEGSKTTHTVPYRPYRGTCFPPPPKMPPPWQPNEAYPVQVRQMLVSELTGDREPRRVTVCWARVSAVWPGFLGDFDDRAAQAEGFEDAGALFQWWRERRDRVEPPASTDRPTTEIPVWTAAIAAVEESRFLAPGQIDPKHVPADEHGYLNSSERAADKAQAVPAEWENVVAMQGRLNTAERERQERAEENARKDARRFGAHLRTVVIDLTRQGIDPTPLIAELERRVRQEEARKAA